MDWSPISLRPLRSVPIGGEQSRICRACALAPSQGPQTSLAILSILTAARLQRKTRCDPALPRCLPCDRAGAICEYFDTTKGKKISRFYVVKLQEKVRRLEAELSQYTDEDEFPRNAEDIVRPGGLVRLNENDETLRYLGPSSGIAMTRLLMEEAKKYTDTKKISELIPDVKLRRLDQRDRMQSIIGYGGSISGPSKSKKKDFPMMSEIAAESLPNKDTVKKLVDLYTTRGTSGPPQCGMEASRER